MKSVLKCLFVTSNISQNDDIQIKQEAFCSKKYYQYDKKNKVHYSYRKPNTLNPPNNNGQVSWCVVCNIKMHWENNYPHNTQSVNVLEDDIKWMWESKYCLNGWRSW